jgi:hypothetical protein
MMLRGFGAWKTVTSLLPKRFYTTKTQKILLDPTQRC